jgi:hypothetical protein
LLRNPCASQGSNGEQDPQEHLAHQNKPRVRAQFMIVSTCASLKSTSANNADSILFSFVI